MPMITPVSAEILSVFACQRALTLLKSLSDGEWASVPELSEATGLDTAGVAAGLRQLEGPGLVQQVGNLYRADSHAVDQHLAMIQIDLCGE